MISHLPIVSVLRVDATCWIFGLIPLQHVILVNRVDFCRLHYRYPRNVLPKFCSLERRQRTLRTSIGTILKVNSKLVTEPSIMLPQSPSQSPSRKPSQAPSEVPSYQDAFPVTIHDAIAGTLQAVHDAFAVTIQESVHDAITVSPPKFLHRFCPKCPRVSRPRCLPGCHP
jgi:hypothetical protein